MSLTAEALDRALKMKIAQLYDTLFNALAMADNEGEAVKDAEQAFQRGLRLAKHCHKTALQLSDTSL